MNNPYQSPESSQTEVRGAQPPRPVAVWIFLLLLALVALSNLIGSGKYVFFLASGGADTHDRMALVIGLVTIVVVLALMGGTIFGVWKRRQWGRWLGIVAIAGVVLFSIFGTDHTAYASDAERTGGHLARYALIPAVMAWWCYAFAFSAKARRYFE